jgi:signal transduction histidine kinase
LLPARTAAADDGGPGGDGPRAGVWSARQVASVVRFLVLALLLLLSGLSGKPGDAFSWFGLLLLLALAASARAWGTNAVRLVTIIEAIGCVVAVLETGGGSSPLFPYLIAPGFAGGLNGGVVGAVLPAGFAGLALVVGGSISPTDDSFAASSAEWVLLAIAAGFAGAWIRRLTAPQQRVVEVDASYAAAYRLLAQLRPVARQLSVGLDPVTIAEGLLQSLRSAFEFDRGAVLVRTGGGRLVPLAHHGGSRDDWDVDVTGDNPFAEAWLSQRERRLARQFSGAPGSALVIPLVIGLRSFGIVGLETDRRSLGTNDVAGVVTAANEAALRLETAMLFDEVRGVATAEERRRLAREIHDGIAQELSYLGYFVDGLAAESRDRDEVMHGQLRQLRAEITRIVSELRLSIFDLRSEVDTHGGLGSALSDYVRSVGQQSDLTVHLSLSEATTRLPAESEAELLRIAQEAITNARKHAEARNLWVTLAVEPPSALLRVEDDGRGLGRARSDSYGLQIMRERARRLRTTVQVEPREPNGTRVEVVLGALPEAATRLSAVTAPPRSGLEEMPTP